MNLKENIVYNHSDNEVLVKTNGDLIYIICNKESQQDIVVRKMINDNCMLESYEVWDEGEDMKWILVFRLLDRYKEEIELN